jgi:hypothetical protein
LLLFSSTQHSISCGTASLNEALRDAQAAHLDMNVLVVVEADLPGEGVGLSEKYGKSQVIEDTRRFAANFFAANSSSPTAALVCPDGTISFSETRLQVRLLNFDTLRARLTYCSASSASQTDPALLFASSDRMDTTQPGLSTSGASVLVGSVGEGSKLLIDAVTPVIRGDSLWVIDPHRNLVRRFLIESGEELSALTVDTSLRRFYHRPGDSEELWRLFAEEGIMPMIVQIVDAHGTHIEAVCRVYEQIDGGSRGSIMRNLRATLENGKVIRVDSLPYLYIKPTAALFGDSLFVAAAASESLDRAIYSGQVGDRVDRDSMWVMLATSSGSGVRPLLPVSTIETVMRRPFRFADAGLLAKSSEKGVFFTDGANNFVLFVEIERGTVERVLPVWDATGRDSLSILGLVGGERSVAVLLEDQHAQAQPQYLVEVVSTDGTPLGSCAVPHAPDLLAAHLLSVDPESVTMLLKRREARWQVWRMPLKQ